MNSGKNENFDFQNEEHSKWLCPSELENTHICAGANVIRDLLYQFQSDMPKYIQARNIGGRRDLCLLGNPLVIRSFCTIANLSQPNEWLTIGELCEKYLHCDPQSVLKIVQEQQTIMPNDIKPQMVLCVRDDARVVDEIRKKIGLAPIAPATMPAVSTPQVAAPIPQNTVHEKTAANWISVSGMMKNKVVHGVAQKISAALKEYQKISPDDILEKTFRGSVILYLRNEPSVIQRFNEMLDSKKPTKSKETKINKDDWLSISLLLKQKIITGTYSKAAKALKDWGVGCPNDVLKKMRGCDFSYYLRNDSDVIQRFSKAFNPKEKDWISCSAMVRQKLVSGSIQKIGNALKEYQKTNPDDVQEMMVKGTTGLHLRNKPAVIQRFVNFLNPKQPEKSTDDVSNQWLSASDLEYRYIDAGFTSITDKLYQLQPTMSDVIQSQDTPRGQKLCLKGAAIQTFCAKSGFCAITPKTSDWLSVTDLIKQNYVPGPYKMVKDALSLNKAYKRDYVQMKIGARGKLSLCLLNNADAITWFRKKMGVSPMSFPDEASKWILREDLPEKYIVAPQDKINHMLYQFSDVLRNEIWIATRRGHSVVYLRRDAIETFCKLAGFKTTKEVEVLTTQAAALRDFARIQSKQK